MSPVSPFVDAQTYTSPALETVRGVQLANHFGDPPGEYHAARDKMVVIDRSDRGLLAITGADGRSWLHRLVSNAIEPLETGRGIYAFALNPRGGILFDMNVLAVGDALWLDVDARAVVAAAAHFDRYLFGEKVRIDNRSGETARLACFGPQAPALAANLGVGDLTNRPPLSCLPTQDGQVYLVRQELGDLTGFELVVPRGQGPRWWDMLVARGARPAGYVTLDVLRTEAGIPWLGRDLDDRVLPAETGQFERAINVHKGCYPGQEIVERMRSRGVSARRLVRLRMDSGAIDLELPATIRRDREVVGQITTLVRHPAEDYWCGLGYLKTSVTGFAEIAVGKPPRSVTICSA